MENYIESDEFKALLEWANIKSEKLISEIKKDLVENEPLSDIKAGYNGDDFMHNRFSLMLTKISGEVILKTYDKEWD